MSLCKVALSRLNELKFNFHKQNVTLSFLRWKIHVAMLENENVQSGTVSAVEFSGLSWLHKVAPTFSVQGSKVTIIHEPSEFYNLLIEKCQTAKKRITLASLYLGTGKLETELVNSLKNSNPDVEITVLLDYLRGSRNKLNSRKMLEPLLQSRENSEVYLYHTPKLRGLVKRLLPDRFNELIGVQHMKLYLFDNTLIISGANLSNDYFTNRQDRYVMIEDCKDLCDFYHRLVRIFARFSYKLTPDGDTVWNADVAHPVENSDRFARDAAESVKCLFEESVKKGAKSEPERTEETTYVFPLVQMGPLNVSHDSEITLRLLQGAPPGATLKLGTGYFNLTTKYRDAILNCQAACHLLTAHPTANGFFRAKGIAGGVPAAYTKLEESFVKLNERLEQDHRVKLWEYVRQGWTYHAKGLWYTLPGQEKPSLTLIGSPNFGYRSVEKDLETQIAIYTKDKKVQEALHKEQERLFKSSELVTSKSFKRKDRMVPAWVRFAVLFFRYYF